jgi:short-subunit dehydrogenase
MVLDRSIHGGFLMDELKAPRPLAVITGASSGIGFHLARIAAEHGYDLILAADTPMVEIYTETAATGAHVEVLECDLATTEGVEELLHLVGDRHVDALMANAGHGLGGAFLEQDFPAILHVINTNITGTVHLIHEVASRMRSRAQGLGHGRILVTGSIAGFQPGAFHAVYNASKAFIDSFTAALRSELKDTRLTVTCLMPGATDTAFFERAELMDTKLGTIPKMDAALVARMGFDAMLKGEADVVTGLANKAQVAMSKVMPSQAVAAMHRKLAEPHAHSTDKKE